MQTYSFFGKQSPVGEKVLKALMAKYPDIKGPGDVTPGGRRGQRLRRDDAHRAGDRERRLDRRPERCAQGFYKIGKLRRA